MSYKCMSVISSQLKLKSETKINMKNLRNIDNFFQI